MSHPNSAAFSREKFKRDEQFWWRPGRVYIPAWQFAGLDYDTGGATTDIKSVGAGGGGTSLRVTEVSTFNMTAVSFDANADTLEHFMTMPGDIDLTYPIYFRVHWTANNTSGSVTWDVLYKPYVLNSTVLASPTTALDATLGAHTMAGVAFTLMSTPEGRIYANKMDKNVEAIGLAVKRTAATTVTSALFLGLEMRYTPHRLYYGSMIKEAKAPSFIAAGFYPN
mgnify:CR=1 FL=1